MKGDSSEFAQRLSRERHPCAGFENPLELSPREVRGLHRFDPCPETINGRLELCLVEREVRLSPQVRGSVRRDFEAEPYLAQWGDAKVTL